MKHSFTVVHRSQAFAYEGRHRHHSPTADDISKTLRNAVSTNGIECGIVPRMKADSCLPQQWLFGKCLNEHSCFLSRALINCKTSGG
ncbi:MAG: hypothetical protein KBS99_04665 [Prevotellaceae bacterium]|nr:hypothetical protein [Candidatus Colivivens caballi]